MERRLYSSDPPALQLKDLWARSGGQTSYPRGSAILGGERLGRGPVRSTLTQRQISPKRANPSLGSLFLRAQCVPCHPSGTASGAPPGMKPPWLGAESTRTQLQKEEAGGSESWVLVASCPVS